MTESMTTMTQVSVPQNQPWICLITPFIFATVNLQILKLAIFLKDHIDSIKLGIFERARKKSHDWIHIHSDTSAKTIK